jgi:hypothetical protein
MDLSTLTANHWMIVAGGCLMLVGFLISRATSRHDLKGAVIDSAWQAARGRRTSDNPTEIEKKLQDIAGQTGVAGKAKAAAGTAAKHVVAQILGLVALIMMLCGAGLIAAGIWWR